MIKFYLEMYNQVDIFAFVRFFLLGSKPINHFSDGEIGYPICSSN